MKAKKVSVIPNATSTLSSKSTKGTQGKKTIAFIGRLTDQKSPGTFIDLARELISRGKDYDFLVVGEGYLMDTLIEKAKQLNLTGYIKFPGFITHDQVQELLSEVDLLICPSVSEPFGLIMLEALRKNVIVLASPGSGLSEFIPISSTAHVTIAGQLLGLIDPAHPERWTSFIAVIQLGTLAAVFVYFKKEIHDIPIAWVKENLLSRKKVKEQSSDSKMGWYILIGSIPIATLGLALKDIIEGSLTKDPLVIASSLIGLAINMMAVFVFSYVFKQSNNEIANILTDKKIIKELKLTF